MPYVLNLTGNEEKKISKPYEEYFKGPLDEETEKEIIMEIVSDTAMLMDIFEYMSPSEQKAIGPAFIDNDGCTIGELVKTALYRMAQDLGHQKEWES